MAAWLETDYVCDRRGRRYVPCWKPQGRVQIDWAQLQRWYRTLDHLLGNKETLEALKTIRQVQFSTASSAAAPLLAPRESAASPKPRKLGDHRPPAALCGDETTM